MRIIAALQQRAVVRLWVFMATGAVCAVYGYIVGLLVNRCR